MTEILRVKMCPVCKKDFVPSRPNQIYCNNKCGKKQGQISSKNSKEAKKTKEEIEKNRILRAQKLMNSRILSIDEVTRRADKMGISYGKYVGYYEGYLKFKKEDSAYEVCNKK